MPLPAGGAPNTAAAASNPFEKMTVTAKTFMPPQTNSTESTGNKGGESENTVRPHTQSVDTFEVFGGY